MSRTSLTQAQIKDLQIECLADDLPVVDGMESWTEDQVRKYFESGGVEKPNAVEDALKGIGNAIGKAFNGIGSEIVKIGSPKLSTEALDDDERLSRRASASEMVEAERERRMSEAVAVEAAAVEERAANQRAANQAMEVERERRISLSPDRVDERERRVKKDAAIAAMEVERSRRVSLGSNGVDELERKVSQEAVITAMEVERERRVSLSPDRVDELERKASQEAVVTAMEVERTRRMSIGSHGNLAAEIGALQREPPPEGSMRTMRSLLLLLVLIFIGIFGAGIATQPGAVLAASSLRSLSTANSLPTAPLAAQPPAAQPPAAQPQQSTHPRIIKQKTKLGSHPHQPRPSPLRRLLRPLNPFKLLGSWFRPRGTKAAPKADGP